MQAFVAKAMTVDAEIASLWLALKGREMSNTKLNHVGMIYQYVADNVIQSSITLEPDGNGGQVIKSLPVDEVVERLCAAFEKVNERVKDW